MIQTDRGFSIPEALVALLVLALVSLGGGAITKYVLLTSKKSKVVILAINLESSLLQTINNANQNGYIGNTILKDLRDGIAVPQIPIYSRFGVPTASEAIYNIKVVPGPPSELYMNLDGDIVTPDKPWVLKLIALYKPVLPAGGSFRQYSLAYEISGNPNAFNFRPFGAKSDPTGFQAQDFTFPLSQLLYIGEANTYTDNIGTCSVPSNQVISLFSVNLETGKTNCVIKGNECADKSVAVGIGTSITSDGDLAIDLKCQPIKKCSCAYIDPKDWVAMSVTPSKLITDNPGTTTCGTCEYVFKKVVPIQMPNPNYADSDTFSAPVCPSQNYDVKQVKCSAQIISAVPAATLCPSAVDPSGQFIPPFDGPDNTTSNTATCDVSLESHGDSCFTWSYRVTLLSGSCVLRSPFSITRDAHAL